MLRSGYVEFLQRAAAQGNHLFSCDNPSGTTEISGAQDTVGLVFPGLARSDYAGTYWPHHIKHLADESALRFV